MTDTPTPKRQRRSHSELGAGEAFDKLCEQIDTRETRLRVAMAKFEVSERADAIALVRRVPVKFRDRLAEMLKALPHAEGLVEAAAKADAEPPKLPDGTTVVEANEAPSDPPADVPRGIQPMSAAQTERVARMTGGKRP